MKQIVHTTTFLLFTGMFLMLTGIAEAQLQPEQIDTLYHAQVAPGMYHTEYEIRDVPWSLQVLRVDKNEQDVEFRTVKANNRLNGLQTPMEMKSELENDSTYVVAGINGDFFQAGGVPVSAQVVDGTLLKQPYPRELLAFNEQFEPFIQTTSFNGSVSFEGSDQTVNGINEERGENHLTVYNSYFGNSTGQNSFGTEVGVRYLDSPRVNQSYDVVVENIESQQGDMELGPYDMVLSGHGSASDFLETLSVEDTLSIQLNLDPLSDPVIEAIGGSTQFVKNGVVDSNWEERHPRTALGFSADTTQVYFVIVDGRQPSSAGMLLSEMGDFMVQIGIDHAINLDGGGSSAMVVQNDVVNNPSGGGQRSVANALFVTMENPSFGDTERIQIYPGKKKLFLGEGVALTVHAYDENHRRERVSNSEIEYSVSEDIGSVNSNGRFDAGYETGSGYIYAESGGMIDSTFIEVIGVGQLSLSPKEVTIDTTMDFQPTPNVRDLDGLRQSLDANRFTWSLTNEEIGTVDGEGIFVPHTTGETGLIASIGEVADTTWILVEQLEGYDEFTTFSDPESWNLSTENLDEELVHLQPLDGSGIELQFTNPSGSNDSRIMLENSFSLDGVPKFAHIETSGDGEDYIVYIDIENPDDGRFRMAPQDYANHTEPEKLEFILETDWASRITSGAEFYFPISIESLILQLPDNNSDEDIEGTFRFHSAGVLYSETSVSNEDDHQTERPRDVTLEQNYPNPFNPSTEIQFDIPEQMNVKLEVFDLIGRRVALLADGLRSAGSHQVTFNASNLASGVYLYRLQTETATISRNMMLIK